MTEDGITHGDDGVARCAWAGSAPDYLTYHDTEWGFPVDDDVRLFEKLSLEGFQSGLSWLTILRKREAFRRAFAGFDFTRVASYTDRDVERLLADASIVRHRGKIEAVINNAQRATELVEAVRVPGRARVELRAVARRRGRRTLADARAVTQTDESRALARDLKQRGWRFVGPTTVYAFMQAMGLVNDHLGGCDIRRRRRAGTRGVHAPVTGSVRTSSSTAIACSPGAARGRIRRSSRTADWYPKRTMSAEERLRFYAAQFPLTEIDSTYYAPPSEQQAKLWAERTPDGFRFDVKAYSLLTGHPTRPKSLWKDMREQLDPDAEGKRNIYAHHLPPDAVEEAWRRFAAALRPLHDAGRLGAVLFQYPRWFTPKKDNRRELEALRERMPDYRIAVEFRSPRWLAEARDRERTLGTLRGQRARASSASTRRRCRSCHACSRSRTPTCSPSASTAAPTRHGTTPRGRRPSASATCYSAEELKELVPELAEHAHEARETHLLMNNCYRDYSVRNAGELRDLLARYTSRAWLGVGCRGLPRSTHAASATRLSRRRRRSRRRGPARRCHRRAAAGSTTTVNPVGGS